MSCRTPAMCFGRCRSPLLPPVGRSSKPTLSAVGFYRRRSASHRRPPRVLVRCRRSILELHHDALVPTSPTTGATRRSSGLAPMSPSAEPPPPPRARSGGPILSDVPQSGYPRCRVTLAAVPNPPHRRWTPEFGRPPPPLLWASTLLCLRVGRASAGFAVGHASSPVPWAAPSAVPVGCIGTVQTGRALKPARWP
jgi:hypothetical protein